MAAPTSLTLPAGKIYLTPVGGSEAYIGLTDGADIDAGTPQVDERWEARGGKLVLADAKVVRADTVVTVTCLESRDVVLAHGLLLVRDTETDPEAVRLIPRPDLSEGAIVALRHAADPAQGRARSLHVTRALCLPNGPVRLKRGQQGDNLQTVPLRFRVMWSGDDAIPDFYFSEPL